jgi:hypothetical protein
MNLGKGASSAAFGSDAVEAVRVSQEGSHEV